MIFDVITSRFPQNYSPQIIYDNFEHLKKYSSPRVLEKVENNFVETLK